MRIRYGAEQNGKPVKKANVYTQNEHGIDIADVDTDAMYVVERLRANGYETYVVGGAVRDLMLGKKPKDFDIVTEATPSKIKKVFRNSRIIGRRFRLVHVYFGPKIFEVSTFRSLADGLTSNTYGTIEEDVLRRDFSLNALFYDPGKQVVVDYVEGMKDIRDKRIRPIIPLPVIFKDDPVRMIRAVKYAATTGFTLSWLLKRRIKKEAPLLASVSPSRLTEELFKIVHSPYAAKIVENLESFGLYGMLQTEASALMGENPLFRARYLKGLAEIRGEGDTETPGGAVAALIRDYLEDAVDWTGGITENYKTAFLAARRFVFPINPPRVELDKGVRLIFAEHGIHIKKSRLFERGGRGFQHDDFDGSGPGAGEPASGGGVNPEGPKRKRRRRSGRRPRSGEGGGPNGGESSSTL
jgi:poly(A) polymerase